MKNKKLFYLSFAAFVITLVGMLWTEAQATCGEKIIIPLEMAPSIAAFKALLVSSCKLVWIARNTYLDFLFILTYTATIFFAFRSLLECFHSLVWLVLLPGLFDSVENVHLLLFLKADESAVSATSFSIYYWCVHIKFALLVVILLCLLVLAVKVAYGKWFSGK